ncbi:MAG: hypothetical protein H7Z39_19990 [Burkholderiaceae bacterium]|nr:hypothetical protein [Burkholderiaceae bacterium]
MAKIKIAGKQNNVAHLSFRKGLNDYNNNRCELARQFLGAPPRHAGAAEL